MDEGDCEDLALYTSGNADALIASVASVNRITIIIAHCVGHAIVGPVWKINANHATDLGACLPGYMARYFSIICGSALRRRESTYTIMRGSEGYDNQLIAGGNNDNYLPIHCCHFETVRHSLSYQILY